MARKAIVTTLVCRRLRPALVDLAVGTLDAAGAAPVQAHLAGCAECRADLAAMRGLPSELRDADLPEPDEDFWRRQRQAIMRRVRASGVPSGRVSTRRWQLVAAAATVVIALTATHTVLVRRAPSGAHSIERLDDDALQHLHELMPVITPATTIEDADSDLLAVHDLGDDDLDALADLLDGSS
jgi:anti-sigma factor RsiW